MTPGILLDINNKLIFEAVGSRVTSSVVRNDSDWDYLVFEQDLPWIDDLLTKEGYETCKTWYQPTENLFKSYRKGPVNILVTSSKEFFRKFMIATRLATQFDLTERNDRVALFQAVLYGKERAKT